MGGNISAEVLWAHIKVMRPYAWLWFDALPVIALYLLLDSPNASFVPLVLVIGICICLDAAATTLNDVFDLDSDRRSVEPNRNQRPLVTGVITPRAAKIQAAALLVLGMSVAMWMGTAVFLAAGFTLAMAVTYSMPPFSFNARPWSSNLFWYVCGTALYLLVAAAAGQWWTGPALLWLAGYLGFFANGENMAKDLRDWDNDTQAGKVTAVVRKGPARAALHSLVGGLTGMAAYLVLACWTPQLPWLFGLSITAVVVAWTARLLSLVGRLIRGYDKATARALHLGYIRVFLAIHVLIAGGIATRLAGVL